MGRQARRRGPRQSAIRAIELLPTAQPGAAPDLLHGTVRTRQGGFTGFVQWDREECVGPDKLDGHTAANLPADAGELETSSSPENVSKPFWGDDAISNVFRLWFSRPLFWIPAVLLLAAASRILRRWGDRLSRSGGKGVR